MNNELLGIWKDWRLHLTVLIIVIISESIGTFTIPIGPGVVTFMPLLYALIFGLALYFTPVVKEKQSKNADPLITFGVGLLLAKIGVVIGPSMNEIIQVGPALLLQEIGNLGTIFVGLPIAIWLGLKREAIGMTHSTGREPNVGLIVDKYGISSPEGRGVMAIYIFGSAIGPLFIGVIAGLLPSILPLHPYSLAMASGLGSGTMMTAASGALIETFPDMKSQITAFAGASNLLSTATGIWVSMFIALPLTEKLYSVMIKLKKS